jgi:hypothetical protein
MTEERKTNKVKIFGSILESVDLINRNWRLVYLDSSSLSHNQIEKIHFAYDKWGPHRDKIGFMRDSIKIGIRNFDIDSLFYSMNHIGDK